MQEVIRAARWLASARALDAHTLMHQTLIHHSTEAYSERFLIESAEPDLFGRLRKHQLCTYTLLDHWVILQVAHKVTGSLHYAALVGHFHFMRVHLIYGGEQAHTARSTL